MRRECTRGKWTVRELRPARRQVALLISRPFSTSRFNRATRSTTDIVNQRGVFLYRRHYIGAVLVTSLLSREVGAKRRKRKKRKKEESNLSSGVGGRVGIRGASVNEGSEKKRKRVASLRRCRFRALPLETTFAPGTAYANGKPARRRYSTSASRTSCITVNIPQRDPAFNYTINDGILQCRA